MHEGNTGEEPDLYAAVAALEAQVAAELVELAQRLVEELADPLPDDPDEEP